MVAERWRCPYVVDGSDGGDRCRRSKGHVDGSTLGQWHLPDCGSAVSDQDAWEVSELWMKIFDEVQATGERMSGVRRGD